MLKNGFSEVDGDLHDVTKWAELYICCLVARLMGCAVSIPVDKRLFVVATSAATRVDDEVSGIPLSGL